MHPIHLAILAGGPSAERGISLKSAAFIKNNLDPGKYRAYTILVNEDGWYDQESGRPVDLNDFSLSLDDGETIRFDFAFLIIHGTPAEDGKIQGYFEMKGIPHSGCDTLASALTFDKQRCKDYLSVFKIPMAPSVLLFRHSYTGQEELGLSLPVFVKPNKNGSSYGVTKVSKLEDLDAAIQKSFQFDNEVIVEEFLNGKEFSCGLVKSGGEVHVFPLTEIVPKGEFFDYDAKYEGASEEITPGRIPQSLAGICQERSRFIYKLLDCKGMVRMDYILVGDEFYLLEVNTIPGLSPTSIVPQMANAYGWTHGRLLDAIVEEALLEGRENEVSIT